jgi:DNA-binding transcriptional LysR family regulator
VSQRIRALEAQMGVELFARNGPRLVATSRAKSLGERLEHALSLMRTAVDDCRRATHPLRVTCAPTFAARWLVPRLGTYQFKLAGLPNAKPQFVATRFPNYELEARAAVQGTGAALLSPVLFADLNTQGALVAPFPYIVEGPNSYWLLGSADSLESHFARWIRSQFAATAPIGFATL